MVTKIRAVIAAAVAFAHNVWAKLPLAVQGALTAIALAAFVFASGYNWQLPAGFSVLDVATWHLLFTSGATFAVALWAAVYPLIQTKLWPQLLPWLLGLLRLMAESEMRGGEVPGPAYLVTVNGVGIASATKSAAGTNVTIGAAPRRVTLWRAA